VNDESENNKEEGAETYNYNVLFVRIDNYSRNLQVASVLRKCDNCFQSEKKKWHFMLLMQCGAVKSLVCLYIAPVHNSIFYIISCFKNWHRIGLSPKE
jgi:hypothetical protein